MRKERKARGKTWYDAASRRLQDRVLAWEGWEKAGAVALYMAMEKEGEVRTDLLLSRALALGKRVYLPRVAGKGLLHLARFTADTALEKGHFGIDEPARSVPGLTAPCFAEEEPDCLVILPALALDRSGVRLGYGGGYYDRFLSSPGTHVRLGLCFSFQLVPHLPCDMWDQRVHAICTEEEILCL
ncbi:MAG: 5-formyltetrahydrofolate cyclo-ligase [Desulfovibrio sp.]|nr:5-formyltetrahydrofolate cyclo-ligase [Desulfovibrio sp.]